MVRDAVEGVLLCRAIPGRDLSPHVLRLSLECETRGCAGCKGVGGQAQPLSLLERQLRV